jgi:virginiamycin A acetyltransferase
MEAITTHPAIYEAAFGVVDADLAPGPPLVVEDDVWIGHNALIMPGCKFIGRGAVIGAGAVVTKNVERYAIMAGVPAKKLRDRFAPDLMAAIEASRWWEMDLEELKGRVRQTPDAVFTPTMEALATWRRDVSR